MIDAIGAELLDQEALERLVTTIAGRPELWDEHVDHGGTERTYASLHRGAGVDIWVLVWRPGNDTGWHDHDVSSGAVRVVEGELTTHALRIGQPERTTEHTAGDTFSFGPTHIHRVSCETDFAVSIHAYSPPLWRLGQYTVADDGELHRTSVSYADELRPLESVA